MTALHIYANRHIKSQSETINTGDWIFLENALSQDLWSFWFADNDIDEASLNITYIAQEEYFGLTGIKFDAIIGNPPYTQGAKLLYTYFFEKSLKLATDVHMIMPVDLSSRHDKLKKHNERLWKHHVSISENISSEFNVNQNNIHYVHASLNTYRTELQPTNNFDNYQVLYPERKRMLFLGGDTDCTQNKEYEDGIEVVYSVLGGDKIVYKKVKKEYVKKSKKWTTSPYTVFVNYTPSGGFFNCAILKDSNYTWTRKVYAIECDSLESAEKTKEWLQSDIIKNEVIKLMKCVSETCYSFSLEMSGKLPTYE